MGSIHCLPAAPLLANSGSAAADSRLLAEAWSCSPHAGTPWPARPPLGLQPLWRCLLHWPLRLLVSRGHCLGTWEVLAMRARAWGPHFGVVRSLVHQGRPD